ncbi:MAG TPA: hypothetical protein VM487_20935 [Phycisphaerae bacterium]|nr:hypothetical protein [Phycisphaerae bacterium]
MSTQPPILTADQITAAYTIRHRTARYREFGIDLTDLVRHRHSHYSPVECHLACAFEALRWMDHLARRWYKCGHATHPVEHLLSRDRGIVSSPYYHNIEFGAEWATGRYSLPGFCDIILLDRAEGEVSRWRSRYRIRAHEHHVIQGPASASMRCDYRRDGFGDSLRVRELLDSLLAFTGDFEFSPNECHPRARRVYADGVRLYLRPGGMWQVHAHYSYPGDPGSSWYVLVAEQQPREPFHWFVERAFEQLCRMCGTREAAEAAETGDEHE